MSEPTPIRGTHHHDTTVRESAYEVWLSYGRSTAQTAVELAVPIRTVQHWCKVDRWRQRHAAEIFPVDRTEAYGIVASNMVAAAIFASEQLRDHLDPDHAFQFVDKVALDAAHGAVDRAGFGPVRVLAAPSISEDTKDSTALTQDDLARLSPAELRALEQGRQVAVPRQRERDAIEIRPA